MNSLKLHTSKTIDIYSALTETELELPFVDEGISAGFPSPASDYIDQALDLNKELIRNQGATFFGRVKGDSMKDEGSMLCEICRHARFRGAWLRPCGFDSHPRHLPMLSKFRSINCEDKPDIT